MEEIISYIMETPENVNGNILREKLKEFKGSGGGSGGGVMIVNTQRMQVDGDSAYVCDKTAGEMMQAMESKTIVLVFNDTIVSGYAPIVSAIKTNNGSQYIFETFFTGADKKNFRANAESDYPYCVLPKL